MVFEELLGGDRCLFLHPQFHVLLIITRARRGVTILVVVYSCMGNSAI